MESTSARLRRAHVLLLKGFGIVLFLLLVRLCRKFSNSAEAVTQTTRENERHLTNSVAVLVLSSRGNFERREAIRNSWAKSQEWVYFILGDRSCPIPLSNLKDQFSCEYDSTQVLSADASLAWRRHMQRENKRVGMELKDKGDLLLVPCIDVYRNLPRKLKLAYKAALERTSAVWFLKIDDDSYVDVPLINKVLSTQSASVFKIVAERFTEDEVLREGKYAEYAFPKKHYPPFPYGAGHAVSRTLAAYLVENMDLLYDYQGEDTSLAIWAAELGRVSLIDSLHFSGKSGNCNDTTKAVIGHNIDTARMISCSLARDSMCLKQTLSRSLNPHVLPRGQ